jgi:protein TonB
MQAQAVAEGKRHLAREASRWRAEGGLARDTRFRRFLLASMLLHVAAGGYAVWAPRSAVREPRALAVVMIDPSLPPPVPTPPPPAPPEPEPPQEVPEPPPVKPVPQQQVEEAVVIPPVPRERPRERPKPTPTPEQRPEPAPPKPPPPPPPSAEELISQLRNRVGATDPRTGVQGASANEGEGEIDAYRQRVLSCFYSKWIGIQRFRRRRDLQVEFELRVAPDGAVVSADKVRTSGEPFLDDSAERAIQRCSPLPPPPPNQSRFRFIFIPGEIT